MATPLHSADSCHTYKINEKPTLIASLGKGNLSNELDIVAIDPTNGNVSNPASMVWMMTYGCACELTLKES